MRKYYRFAKLKFSLQKLRYLIFDPKESPLKKALAVAMGVFIGVLPIWGVQIASAIVSAQFFKLNKTLAVIGSYINVTPFFPLIIFLSLKIGFIATGNTEALPALGEISFETAKQYFWLFLIGSIPIAIIFSLVFGAITYSAASLFRVKPSAKAV